MTRPQPTSSPPAPHHRNQSMALRRRRRRRAGLVQLGYIAAGAAIGLAIPHIAVGPTISVTQLDTLFAGIGAGLMALISVVWALLFLVIQFGSTTHSPRLNLFRDSPLVTHAFGFFLGAGAYITTVALAGVPGESLSVVVPVVGLLSVLASLAIARKLQLSALDSVQLAPILQDVRTRGRAVVDELYPDPYGAGSVLPWSTPARSHGIGWPFPSAVLRQIDLPALLAVAERLDTHVTITVGVGDMLWEDAVFLELSTAPTADAEAQLTACVEAGVERSLAQDPLLALRLLTDIGLRATSPGINDPYTAVQVIDAIEALLRPVATRHLDEQVFAGVDGRPRVRLRVPTWEEFVAAGLDDLIDAGRNIPSVRRRLIAAVESLSALSPPARVPPLTDRRARLTDS